MASKATGKKDKGLTETQADILSMMHEYDAWLEPDAMGPSYVLDNGRPTGQRMYRPNILRVTVTALEGRGYIKQNHSAPFRTLRNLYITAAGREALRAYEAANC